MVAQCRRVTPWACERASIIESCGVDIDRIVDSRSTPALLPFFGSACTIYSYTYNIPCIRVRTRCNTYNRQGETQVHTPPLLLASRSSSSLHGVQVETPHRFDIKILKVQRTDRRAQRLSREGTSLNAILLNTLGGDSSPMSPRRRGTSQSPARRAPPIVRSKSTQNPLQSILQILSTLPQRRYHASRRRVHPRRLFSLCS